jgi:hypothetical protein
MPSFSMTGATSAMLGTTLALFMPARLAIRIAQAFNAVRPLTGLVRMMWALS